MKFQDVESAREKYRQKIKKIGITSILVVAALAIFAGVSGAKFLLFITSFALILGIFLTVFVPHKEAKAYKKAYKTYFIEQNLKKTFANLKYDHTQGLDISLLKATEMLNTGDRFSSNDLTLARYKNVAFAQSDVHIENAHTDSDGDTHYSTIFKGRVMFFEFPKKFNFKLELVGKKFPAYRIPRKDQNTGRKMRKISTESSEFNHNFRIFGEDGFEAFYILDPAFMVKIQTIAKQHKYNLLFGFIENKLLIALNDGKDVFEPASPWKPIDEKTESAKVFTDIKTITDFIDQLSLERKLFK